MIDASWRQRFFLCTILQYVLQAVLHCWTSSDGWHSSFLRSDVLDISPTLAQLLLLLLHVFRTVRTSFFLGLPHSPTHQETGS